ncbi:hypothetical protein EV363DRAFT_1448284 [Boletus edulis]|nr:hypothetical protein EV363DRAFT_1448284 [Boletus edulis]
MSDIPQLPAFLDPLLNYLSEQLPPELYSFITSFLSHFLTLLTAFISLLSSLLASKPWEWEAQTIIPPIISFLAAYLALLSLYRTTSWIFRTTFWFIKWGTIFGVLAASAGWYMGNQDPMGGVGGLVSTLGAVLLGALNGDGRDGAGARVPQTTPRTTKSRTKPWEPFQNQWQYREDNPTQARDNGAQQIMSDIVAAANRVLVEGGWWDTARTAFTQTDPQNGKEGRSTKQQSSRSSGR